MLATDRHATLLCKFALLDIPGATYNWLVEYFSGRSHCTRFGGSTSTLVNISASIVQESAVGPVSFNAADLTTATPGNQVHFDDTNVVIPARNIQSRADELEHVALWAQANNLNQLNRAKTVEVIIIDSMSSNCVTGHSSSTSIQMLGESAVCQV